MARNWDSISNIFLKISFLSDKSDTYVLMVLVSYNIMARASSCYLRMLEL